MVLEREVYIQKALDHLNDPLTYKSLSKSEALCMLEQAKQATEEFVTKHSKSIPKSEVKYLRRTASVEDPFPQFYILAKIHKTPWKVRPITSVSGSQTEGLGKWLDSKLQVICKTLPTYLKSSFQLVKEVSKITNLPPNARLFTADANSMYTNIDTDHALEQIGKYFYNARFQYDLPFDAIKDALEIVMRAGIFQFGDTYWHQLTGTVMGTPPAPMYATLYFAIHELAILPHHREILRLYKRFLDDIFGIWIPTTENDDEEWELLSLA